MKIQQIAISEYPSYCIVQHSAGPTEKLNLDLTRTLQKFVAEGYSESTIKYQGYRLATISKIG